jgi:hypothetical protein
VADITLDPVIGHATAQRALHAVANLRVGGIRRLVEECLGGEHLPVLAEPTCGHLLVDPRLLNRMQLSVFRETFKGGDLDVLHLRHRPHARAHGFAVDQHGAGAALAQPAAKARAGQVKIVAEDVKKRRRGLDLDRVPLPVDEQVDRSHPGDYPRNGRRSTADDIAVVDSAADQRSSAGAENGAEHL